MYAVLLCSQTATKQVTKKIGKNMKYTKRETLKLEAEYDGDELAIAAATDASAAAGNRVSTRSLDPPTTMF